MIREGLQVILIGGLSLICLYLAARLITAGIMRSLKDARNHKEGNNGEEE